MRASCRFRALIFALAFALPACEAYEPPPLPLAPTRPGASTVPTRIVLTAGSRVDLRLDVEATVLSADGRGVPDVAVVFNIGAGSLDPAIAMTDRTGIARTIAVSSEVTTISAAIGGGIESSVDVLQSPQP